MTTRDDCIARDAADPLRATRELFALPKDLVYLDGNSLGPLPRATAARIAQVVQHEWGEGLIRSWNDAGWFAMPARLGNRIAGWIGAGPGEVVATDTTSVNLYKVLAAALRIAADDKPTRGVVLSERSNFPTDLYIAQSLCEERGRTLRLEDFDAVERGIDDRTAVVLLTHVNYRTGAMLDMQAVTKKAHDAGALVVWDLAHSAGAVPVNLLGADADFAIGCGYKYLNGGPGAPAFAWVHPRHADRFRQPLAGWWGHEAPFAFDPQYRPARGIARYLCGTQSVLGMAALGCGLDTLDASLPAGGMQALRAKSLALTNMFIALIEERLSGHGFAIVTPDDHAARGSQVSLALDHGAYEIVQALIARGVIGDFRAPDILRFGFTPLYVRFADVWDAVEHLKQIMDSGAWRQPQYARRNAVT